MSALLGIERLPSKTAIVRFGSEADVVIITAILIRDEVRVTAQPLITALRAAAGRW